MGVCSGNGLWVLEGVDFLFASDFVQGVFLRVIILEAVGFSDFTVGGSDMTYFLIELEAEEERSTFYIADPWILLMLKDSLLFLISRPFQNSACSWAAGRVFVGREKGTIPCHYLCFWGLGSHCPELPYCSSNDQPFSLFFLSDHQTRMTSDF